MTNCEKHNWHAETVPCPHCSIQATGSEVCLTETTNINNLTEQPAILKHVARLNDEITNLTAQCAALKEKLDEAECAAINTELQDKIRGMFLDSLGPNFKGDIDGAGSDAGPWEFTLSEISQGIGHLCEQRDEATRIAWESVATWAQMRWDAEVKHRPEVNIYRAVLDTTWKQVINKAKETIEGNAVMMADSENAEHCTCIAFAECDYHAGMRAERNALKKQLDTANERVKELEREQARYADGVVCPRCTILILEKHTAERERELLRKEVRRCWELAKRDPQTGYSMIGLFKIDTERSDEVRALVEELLINKSD
jgi:hypothetical protein